MAGSLYFSEVAHFPPCHLCWLQRYCMYPLVPILGFAAWRQAGWIRPLAAGALAAIGAVIATYHVLLERNPHWESSVCDPKNPCTLIWVERLGYLTIPTMALSGFLLILTLLAVSRAGDRLTTRPTSLEERSSWPPLSPSQEVRRRRRPQEAAAVAVDRRRRPRARPGRGGRSCPPAAPTTTTSRRPPASRRPGR